MRFKTCENQNVFVRRNIWYSLIYKANIFSRCLCKAFVFRCVTEVASFLDNYFCFLPNASNAVRSHSNVFQEPVDQVFSLEFIQMKNWQCCLINQEISYQLSEWKTTFVPQLETTLKFFNVSLSLDHSLAFARMNHSRLCNLAEGLLFRSAISFLSALIILHGCFAKNVKLCSNYVLFWSSEFRPTDANEVWTKLIRHKRGKICLGYLITTQWSSIMTCVKRAYNRLEIQT